MKKTDKEFYADWSTEQLVNELVRLYRLLEYIDELQTTNAVIRMLQRSK